MSCLILTHLMYGIMYSIITQLLSQSCQILFTLGSTCLLYTSHVFRVSNRIGLAHAKNVEETEKQLQRALDPSIWLSLIHI